MRLLIVEDEEDMLYALKKGLKNEGYAIDLAADGLEALALLEVNEYDGLILDINLPKLDGMEVLERLRERNHSIKILILSAKSEIDDRVMGLDKGANDYLVKPFHLKELKARLRALLRRQFVSLDTISESGKLSMDISHRQVFYAENEIPLTTKEFALLRYLWTNHDVYQSSEQLIEHVWNEEADLFSNALRVHIHALRKKLSSHTGFSNIIESIPQEGYKFNSHFEEP